MVDRQRQKKGKAMNKDVRTVTEISTRLSKLAEETKRLTDEAAELKQKLRIARGTRDNVKMARATEYFVGDEGPTPQLYDAVERMLRQRSMTFQELLDETGARANRIKGVLMRIQRDEKPLVNLGSDRKALWRIADPNMVRQLRMALRGR